MGVDELDELIWTRLSEQSSQLVLSRTRPKIAYSDILPELGLMQICYWQVLILKKKI